MFLLIGCKFQEKRRSTRRMSGVHFNEAATPPRLSTEKSRDQPGKRPLAGTFPPLRTADSKAFAKGPPPTSSGIESKVSGIESNNLRDASKVSEGPCGASYRPEASRHWPVGHACAAEGRDGVPQGPAASSQSACRQASGTVGEMACRGAPQRRVSPLAGRQAEQLEPFSFVDDVHLLEFSLGLREIEDALDDSDDPNSP